MRPERNSLRPVGGAEAEGHTTGQQDDHCKLTCDLLRGQPTAAADTWRSHAPTRLSAAAGVRPVGPLGWLPPDPPPREDAVAIARRRELARRSAAERERRWAQLREVRRYWTAVA
jgi:hypothetical protein